MSTLDVDALLESTARSATSGSQAVSAAPSQTDDLHRDERQDRRQRDRPYDRDDRPRDRKHRARSRDRRSGRESAGDDRTASHVDSRSSRRRSRSRESDRRPRRERRRRPYSRSRSPDDDRFYRPSGRSRRDTDRDRGPRRRRRSPSPTDSHTPTVTEDDRDRRTIFVQQLAVHLRTKELIDFFEKSGPVKDAQIVKDRVSNRSKGVGYVEFEKEESVALALQLTGQKLLGIPIIAQLTESEKNAQTRGAPNQPASQRTEGPHLFYRLYVGNIHFNITEADLRAVFEPFGELEFVQLQKEESGRSKGYGFVQYTDASAAKEALEKMNGFDLAGRPIRVGLGNDRGNNHAHPNQRNHNHVPAVNPANPASHFDRIGGGRESDAAAGGASALDDSDVVGVNFNNFSRDALMRKLARVDPPAGPAASAGNTSIPTAAGVLLDVPQASRCVVVKNMFNSAEESGDDWHKELESDVRDECQAKYGDVVNVIVDPSTDGDVYIKFKTVDGGENAIKGLNGRFFGGRQITAQPVVDAVYSLFSRSRAM